MLDTADRDGIHGMHGNAVIVDPADLLGLAEYLESIMTSTSGTIGTETPFMASE